MAATTIQPPPPRRVSVSGPPPGEAEANWLAPHRVMAALLKHRYHLLCVVLPASIIAAALGWWLTPAKYTAYTIVRLSATPPRLLIDTAEQKTDFQTYRESQMALIQSSIVLEPVLRKLEVAALDVIQQKSTPLPWLQEELDVSSQISPEFIRIELTERDPVAAATIVNAVRESYFEKVVDAEFEGRRERFDKLNSIYKVTEKDLKDQRTAIRELAEQLGTSDSKALSVKQQMALEYFAQLKREHLEVRFNLMRAQSGDTEDITVDDLRVLRPRDPEAASRAAALLVQIDAQREKVARLQTYIRRFRAALVSESHPDLDDLEAKLKIARADLQRMEEIAAGTGDSVAGPRKTDRVAALERQEKNLREELERYTEQVKGIGHSSLELETMKNELKQAEGVAELIKKEIEGLKIELQSPSRVRLIEAATPPKRLDNGPKKKAGVLLGAAVFALLAGLVLVPELLAKHVYDASELERLPNIDAIHHAPAGEAGTTRILASLSDVWLQSHSHPATANFLLALSAELGRPSLLPQQLADALANLGYNTRTVLGVGEAPRVKPDEKHTMLSQPQEQITIRAVSQAELSAAGPACVHRADYVLCEVHEGRTQQELLERVCKLIATTGKSATVLYHS